MSQITIVTINGKTCPHFQCDYCNQPVKDGTLANLIWRPEEPEKTRIVCKICDDKDRPGRGFKGHWMDLVAAWHWLGTNSKIDPKQAAHQAELLERMG